jgi:1-acyl-sn-glycerol-3-phosphate acyltransferase
MPPVKSVGQICASAVIWGIACTQLAFWTAIIVTLSLVVPPRRLMPVARLGARAILRGAGIRLCVRGLENLPRNRPVVLMGNHVNLIDPFLVAAAFPIPIVALERASHFRWPVYGWLISRWGNIPVLPGRLSSTRTTLKRAQDALRRGLSLAIFPEGTRTRTGSMGPFHKGAFYIAQQAGADVVPFATRGGFALNRRGSLVIRPGTIELIVGTPLRAEQWAERPLDELMEATRAAIARHAAL